MGTEKLSNWAIIGVSIATLGAVLFSASSLSGQLSAVQGDVAELKAAVDGVIRLVKEHEHQTAATKPGAAAPGKEK